MFFKENKKSSMEQEIFEQAAVLENLLRTHVNDNNYILFDIPTDILLQAVHLIIVRDMLLIYLEMLPAWRLVQFIQANFC